MIILWDNHKYPDSGRRVRRSLYHTILSTLVPYPFKAAPARLIAGDGWGSRSPVAPAKTASLAVNSSVRFNR